MEKPLKKNWPELYKQALLETDHSLLFSRIDEAEKAIQRRALGLCSSQSPETKERQNLEVALRFLTLPRTLALNTDIGKA